MNEETLKELEKQLDHIEMLSILVQTNIDALKHCMDLFSKKLEELHLEALSETAKFLDKTLKDTWGDFDHANDINRLNGGYY